MASNPIQYTSRTFTTVLEDINSDPKLADKPIWFKRLIAGLADTLSVINNAVANQSFLRTSFTKQAVVDHLELIDFALTPHTTSSGTLRFFLNENTRFPLVIKKEKLVAITEGTLAASAKRFEVRVDATVAKISESFIPDESLDELRVARDYKTGEKVRLSTTATLPVGLSESINYYVIRVSATQIKLATSLHNARSGIFVEFTNNGLGIHTITIFSFDVPAFQQESLDDTVVIGRSDGITKWQEFDLLNTLVLGDTLVIEINNKIWTRVASFIDSRAKDKHYRLFTRTEGTAFIRFGDGNLGQIPQAGFDIKATYAFGGGANSNVFGVGKVGLYAGSDIHISGVENITDMSGASDEQDFESAKKLAPILLKTRDRFVTIEDGIALSLAFGGISRVKINKNKFGLLSAEVVIVPFGGGVPSAKLKSDLQVFLVDRTILGSMDIRVVDPIFLPVNITAHFKPKSGFSFSNVLPFFNLGLKLIFSEATAEIVSILEAKGIVAATNFINGKFHFSFGSDSDLSQIKTMLENINPIDFGGDIQLSDVHGFMDTFVRGVDYLTIASPTFPIVTSGREITTAGLMKITEIT